MRRKISISQPYLYVRVRNHKDRVRTRFTEENGFGKYSGIYTKTRWNMIDKFFWDGLEKDLEPLATRIHELASSLSHAEVRDHIKGIQYFGVTQEYSNPFLRESVFDYYFSRNDPRFRWMCSRPRMRVLNPSGYGALPFMPVGFSSRFFQEDRPNHFNTAEFDKYVNHFIDREYVDTDREGQPSDVLESFFNGNGVYDFVVHPMIYLVDKESQKRLLRLSVKGLAIWSIFAKEIFKDGKEKDLFIKHMQAYLSQEGKATNDAKEEYYTQMKKLPNIRKLRPNFLFTAGVDDFLFMRKLAEISRMSRRALEEIVVASLIGKQWSSKSSNLRNVAWFVGSSVYFSNYLLRLLFFILYELVKDDAAYQFMEGEFQSLSSHPSERNTNMYRKDQFKQSNRSPNSGFMLYDSKKVIHRGKKLPSYGYNTNVVFLSDEPLWMDDMIQEERTAASYGQFLYPVNFPSLEEVFELPKPYRTILSAIYEMQHYKSITFDDMKHKWEFLLKMRKTVDRESNVLFEQYESKIPHFYFSPF